MITAKERLHSALRLEQTDRPPCICPGGMMNMVVEELMDLCGISWPAAHNDPTLMANLAAAVYEQGTFENYGVPFCMTVEAEAMGAGVDLGSKINEPRVNAYPIRSVTEWEKLLPMDLQAGRARVVLEAIKNLQGRNQDVPIIATLTGPISLASSLMEPMDFYKELRSKSSAAHELMTFVTKNLIAFGRALVEAGADIIAIADPSGTGEILGPKMFGEYGVTYLNMLLDELNEATQGQTIVHICGKLQSIYQELNALNCQAISFDSNVSVRQVKESVTGKAIMGNVSTFALEHSTPEQVLLAGRNCLERGVDILSPACGIGPRTPLNNLRSLTKAVQDPMD